MQAIQLRRHLNTASSRFKDYYPVPKDRSFHIALQLEPSAVEMINALRQRYCPQAIGGAFKTSEITLINDLPEEHTALYNDSLKVIASQRSGFSVGKGIIVGPGKFQKE
jgi:hypothetical protein